MAGKTIEARAVISASDQTGGVFDKIAAKFKNVERAAKAIDKISPASTDGLDKTAQALGNVERAAKSLEKVKAPRFAGDLYEELRKLKLSEKELQSVRKEWTAFDRQLKSGPVRAASYLRSVEEWQGKTIDKWRNVKSAVSETDKAHTQFFRNAGRFALHAAGIGGAAYMAGRVLHTEIDEVSKRNRAKVRYSQMGISERQLGEGNIIADQISSKFPTIGRTEVLDYLRTNASRLGSWEHSKEIAETYARAMVANKMSGGTEHELEQIVRALEGSGHANTGEQLAKGLNMFARAKAANPDYTGEQFRSDFAAASAAKYAVSDDYMDNVFPILASHTTGFGNKMATGLSALVGGRMKKEAKGALQQYGLMKDGKLVDQQGFITNSYKWTQEQIKPKLEAAGIHFGENMSNEDKAKTIEMTSKMFSAKNAQDLILSYLFDAPLVERARQRKTKNLDETDDLQRHDVGMATEGVITQLKDFGTALVEAGTGVKGLAANITEVGKWISERTNAVNKAAETGKANDIINALPLPEQDREDLKSMVKGARTATSWVDTYIPGAGSLDDLAYRWSGGRVGISKDAQQWYREHPGEEPPDAADFDAHPEKYIDGYKSAATLEEERLAAEQKLRDNRREAKRKFVGSVDWRPDVADADAGAPLVPASVDAAPKIPELPRTEPAPAVPPPSSVWGGVPVGWGGGGGQPASAQVTGTVQGEVTVTQRVEPSPYLVSIIEDAKRAAKVVGQLNSNGPGSLGHSSPDAAAPAVGGH